MSSNLEALKSVAKDALLEGTTFSKAKAINVLLEEMSLFEALKEIQEQREPRIGDILVHSWGWEQTNISYYQVVKKTAKSVCVQRVCASLKQDVTERTQVWTMPVKDSFSEHSVSKMKRVKYDSKTSYSVKINEFSGNAHLWDGTAQWQTAAGYGH